MTFTWETSASSNAVPANIDSVPAIEEEGQISVLRQIDQRQQKFMKGLNQKFDVEKREKV